MVELVIILGFAFLTGMVAHYKGYNEALAFFIGLIFPLFGFLGYLILPDKSKQQEQGQNK